MILGVVTLCVIALSVLLFEYWLLFGCQLLYFIVSFFGIETFFYLLPKCLSMFWDKSTPEYFRYSCTYNVHSRT